MAWDATVNGTLETTVLTQAQGHAFVMESQRIGMLEGKLGAREGLVHQIIAESGSGQSRGELPGGMGGTPTVVGPATFV
jgi:hypothetical protein